MQGINTANRITDAATQIKWDVTQAEFDLIVKIAERADLFCKQRRMVYAYREMLMDLNACHANGTPLRLAELLEAEDFEFYHDVFGIANHIDRTTGKIVGFFEPRYAA